jgi:hypothetical protein
MKNNIKQMTTPELITHFKSISADAYIKPFENIELKKYDTQNVKSLRAYSRIINSYISCIQELRLRGFTLQEIMGEILK